MANTEEWPPRSPMKTLLSSPSGRKRYREYQDLGVPSTSPNKLLGSPSLLEQLRAARANRDHEILALQTNQPEDDDEDEETLQLKLQAIEAKLKLKKLQQQKARDAENVRPQTSESAPMQVPSIASRVEVKLSPTKRLDTSILPKSPSRVILGIDKGLNAVDVSLKRARTIHGSPTKQRIRHVESRTSRAPPPTLTHGSSLPTSAASTPAKSFSERMAEMRGKEKDKEQKLAATRHARLSRFRLDKKEMASYHAASEQQHTSAALAKENTGSDRENKDPNAGRLIKHSRSMPSLRSTSPTKSSGQTLPHATSSSTTTNEPRGDPSLYEGFSGTHLSTRILPHSFLKRTLPTAQFTVYTLPKLLKEVTSPNYEISDTVTDYVVFAIIASMSSPRDHKAKQSEQNSVSSADWEKKWNDGTSNHQKFIVATLTDLKWTVDLFLFDTAVPRYHRLAPGTLIAILNPGIMPPKKGREDTGAFSLTLHDGEDQILEIGKAKHLGYCSAKKRDGHECGSWIDSSKTEICEFHLNAQIDRARSNRSGINSMDFLQKGGSSHYNSNNRASDRKRTNKRGFDHESQSFYYAVGGTAPQKSVEERWSFAPTHNPNLSTAKLLDTSNPDDPFLAEGQMLERDKQDRLRKRMAAMQKEHEIAKRLAHFNGSAGGQYMRHRTHDPAAAAPHDASTRNIMTAGPGITKEAILGARPGESSKKRAADSVRLSPVKKKTRFVTEKGIKEAGRESLGSGGGGAGFAVTTSKSTSTSTVTMNGIERPRRGDAVMGRLGRNDEEKSDSDDDDDDDLDIV